MTNAELIEALRNCADYSDCGICKLNGKFNCADMMMRDAADALEADDKRIDELEKQVKNYRNDKMREDDPLRPMWPNWD